MWRVLPLLMACNMSEDPCESFESYSEVYEEGYSDGVTCAGYNNPYDDKSDLDPPDTDAERIDLEPLDEDSCLWSAYDDGFSGGRSGADCGAGYD
jgi:hypothetical protein